MSKEDAILQVYGMIHNAHIHNKNTFGTPEEQQNIRDLIFCGSYENAVRAIGRIKGGRGGGEIKRKKAKALLRTLYTPIIKVHLGSAYALPNGSSSIALALEKFRREHPECEQFYGDMRKDKTPCKTVYRLYVYDPKTKINTYKYVFIER